VDARSGSFVEALLAAPLGVALLAALEAEHSRVGTSRGVPSPTDAAAVERAAAAIDERSFARLATLALDVAERLAGPWMPGAPDSLALAYRDAAARRPIAEAIARSLGPVMHGDLDRHAQEWWTDGAEARDRAPAARFTGFDHVYGNGEFTFDGLWTVTDPPAETHDELLRQWEYERTPVTRWRLPVRPEARVFEIHRPGDWTSLVEAYPKEAPNRSHAGWELPGPNQHRREIAALLAVPGQHAVRADAVRQLLPDWVEVAGDYDGVHLSWAGFVTTEGFVQDLGEGTVTMLRYWASERTLWLADVFGDPAPLAAPATSTTGGDGYDDDDVDAGAAGRRRDRDRDRDHDRDRAVLTALLGR
jgi:hypothetical protein